MTHVLRIAHLRIAHQVANPEVGKREGNQLESDVLQKCVQRVSTKLAQVH